MTQSCRLVWGALALALISGCGGEGAGHSKVKRGTFQSFLRET